MKRGRFLAVQSLTVALLAGALLAVSAAAQNPASARSQTGTAAHTKSATPMRAPSAAGARPQTTAGASTKPMAPAAQSAPAAPALEKATFAMGCFWCAETAFEGLPGVVSVTSGYTGGFKKDPTYEEVSAGTTGHAESVQIVFDPSQITYARLLELESLAETAGVEVVEGSRCGRGHEQIVQ